MDILSSKWLSEMETEDSTFLDPYQMDPLEFSLDRFDFQSLPLYQENLNINSTKIIQNPQNPTFSCERPAKLMETTSWEPCTTITKPSPSPSSQIISFESSNPSPVNENTKILNSSVINADQYGNYLPERGQGTKRKACSGTRAGVLAKEHVLAERKRREKVNERFIALSALLPGLKKADKASVLEDAIKHLKQLQERVKMLEEQEMLNRKLESVIFVKKSQIVIDDDTSSSSSSLSEENFSSQLPDQPLPEIEAKVSRNEMLIRIHCEKSKGCLVNILSEIEKLGLSVINSIFLPFGDSTLDISVHAKMEDFCMPVRDVVKKLRLAMLQFP